MDASWSQQSLCPWPKEEYYEVVGEVLDRKGILPKVHLLVEQVKTLVERNDPVVKLINIC